MQAEHVPEPVPGRLQALIRVRAAYVNPLDVKLRAGPLRRGVALRFPGYSDWVSPARSKGSDRGECRSTRAVIDSIFLLERIAEAHERFEQGRAHGKIVVTIP